VTSENTLFQRFWVASLLGHITFFVFLFVLPTGSPQQTLSVYTVTIVDVPAQPPVRALDLSTGAISELKLESASLVPDIIPPTKMEVPSAGMITPPSAESPLAAPPKLPSAAPAPKAPAAITGESALPSLPTPMPEVPQPSAPATLPSPPVADAPQASAPQTTALPSSPLDKLREKVQSLQIEFEPVEKGTAGTGMAAPDSASSMISLRIYQNRLQEAIKRNYKFPGNFPDGLQARVRVTINRDGSVTALEIAESSGNKQFDYAAMLALRRAKFPPLPDSVENDTLTQVILFSP